MISRNRKHSYHPTQKTPTTNQMNQPFETIATIALSKHHYMDKERLQTLHKAITHIEQHKIPGDIVECGTASGCSALILLNAITTQRKLWLYDTWTGIPPAGEKDDPHATETQPHIHGTLQEVKQLINQAQLTDQNIIYKKGNFTQTFQDPTPQQIAALHIDSDWYDSVKQTLTAHYHQITPGGIIIIDDYGYYDGVVKALHDYLHENQQYPLITTTSRWQSIIIKNKTNNRDYYWH